MQTIMYSMFSACLCSLISCVTDPRFMTLSQFYSFPPYCSLAVAAVCDNSPCGSQLEPASPPPKPFPFCSLVAQLLLLLTSSLLSPSSTLHVLTSQAYHFGCLGTMPRPGDDEDEPWFCTHPECRGPPPPKRTKQESQAASASASAAAAAAAVNSQSPPAGAAAPEPAAMAPPPLEEGVCAFCNQGGPCLACQDCAKVGACAVSLSHEGTRKTSVLTFSKKSFPFIANSRYTSPPQTLHMLCAQLDEATYRGLPGAWRCDVCATTAAKTEAAEARPAAPADQASELRADVHRVAGGRSLSNTVRRQVRWLTIASSGPRFL